MAAAGAKILLIDDDSFFLKVLSDAFSGAGFTVVTASDGLQGVKAYVQEHPDVVVSDLVMPNMGGVSTCLEIARQAGGRDPIIVLLTSMFKGAPHEHTSPEMGAKVHIPKSTPPLDIVIIIEQLLERKARASAA
ncbi:response regulator [Geomonas sp. Red32]|uniref:response regulator n=1 Tax=Geomonas sp. Red32 TaxID=2912856 RepID=UPI00202CE96D|nr:response regulator [Geomonas sp. Red32]MCM0081581.1 response regulator [Geomonas sp. Red32]